MGIVRGYVDDGWMGARSDGWMDEDDAQERKRRQETTITVDSNTTQEGTTNYTARKCMNKEHQRDSKRTEKKEKRRLLWSTT